jgi:hypothetical protein
MNINTRVQRPLLYYSMKIYWLLSALVDGSLGTFAVMTTPLLVFETNFNEMTKRVPCPTSNPEGHDISLCPAPSSKPVRHGRSYRQPYCQLWLLDVEKLCFDRFLCLYLYFRCNCRINNVVYLFI